MTNINRGAPLSTANAAVAAEYTFNPAAGLVSIPDGTATILSITNLTRNVVIYNPIASVGGALEVPGTVRVDRDTTAMLSTDRLLVIVDRGSSNSTDTILGNILEELQQQTYLIQSMASR